MNSYKCHKSTRNSITIALTLALGLGVTSTHAEQLASLDTADVWQTNRLFTPTARQLEMEHKGSVVIYDGLTDVMVEKALDQDFNRIQSMMFTRVIQTGKNGQPLRDESGEVIVADDGC